MLGGCRELTHKSRWAGKSVISREGSETSLPHLPHDSSKPDVLSTAPMCILHISFKWGDDFLISWYGEPGLVVNSCRIPSYRADRTAV